MRMQCKFSNIGHGAPALNAASFRSIKCVTMRSCGIPQRAWEMLA